MKRDRDELAQLVEVLEENRSTNDFEGWFKIPWRNGWAAIHLCKEMFMRSDDINDFIREKIATGDVSSDAYWHAGELLASTTLRSTYVDRHYVYAALRCFQVLASNSSGGGDVYNTILRRAVMRHNDDGYVCSFDQLETIVEGTRCYDALGIWPTLKNDANDRLRNAFHIAWSRGLYHAAYSIKPPPKP